MMVDDIKEAETQCKITPSGALLEELGSRDSEDDELWGLMIPKSAVVLLVGEASAGKTHFLYRLIHNLCEGEELLGLKPPRPLKVLHIDLESPDSVKEDLLSITGPSERWFFMQLNSGVDLRQILRVVSKHYDLIIVDSLQVAFPVFNEDDNSEANRQMTPIIDIARLSRATIVLIHNSGKGHTTQRFKARGASVRVDRADIVLNLDKIEGEKHKRKLTAVKSRFGNLDDSIEFEFAEDLQYRLLKGIEKPKTKIQEVEKRILAMMDRIGIPGTEVRRRDLVERLGIESDSGNERLFDRALLKLVQREALLRPRHGIYSLPGLDVDDSDSSDTPPNPIEPDLSDVMTWEDIERMAESDESANNN